MADEIGVPLAEDKTEGPTMVLCFLGIIIDTDRMECVWVEEDPIESLTVLFWQIEFRL